MSRVDRLPHNVRELIFGADATKESVAALAPEERLRRIRAVNNRLTSVANSRIDRQREVGLMSPAMKWVNEELEGGRFGLGWGAEEDDLVQNIVNANRFLNLRTSGLRGANKYIDAISERLGIEGSRVDIEQKSAEVFRITSYVDQYLKSAGGGYAIGSDELQQYVSKFMQDNRLFDTNRIDVIDAILSSDVLGSRREVEDNVFGNRF